MNFHVLTIFPENVRAGLVYGMMEKALRRGIITLNCVDIRAYSQSRHKKVDDAPYGGGDGMIMQAQPIYSAYKALGLTDPHRVLYMTPQGARFTQRAAEALSKERQVVILCGRYEGVDERVIEEIVTDEVSLGDFVLTGGELAAMAVIDATARLLPGVLRNDGVYKNDSLYNGLLEYPQYTRPYGFNGRTVPEVLLSGHHENIRKWRHEQALRRTEEKRPDLYGLWKEAEDCQHWEK